jgi:hypothetical protein
MPLLLEAFWDFRTGHGQEIPQAGCNLGRIWGMRALNSRA